jgi:hypothetical protein
MSDHPLVPTDGGQSLLTMLSSTVQIGLSTIAQFGSTLNLDGLATVHGVMSKFWSAVQVQ